MRRVLSPLLLVFVGCASISPQGHDQVAATVQERIGATTGWADGPPEPEQISQRVDALLEQGLTADRVVQLALFNNPRILMTYEGLGISQADMVQAGLLSNPTLAGSVGFPIGPRVGGERIEYEVSLVQNFLDLFVLPLRKRVAGEQFIADTLLVADETLALAAEARISFARFQASDRMVEMQRLIVRAALAAAAEMEARFQAGNVTKLAYDAERAAYEETRLELARAEISRIEAREEVNRLLGLWGSRTGWKLAEPLPEMLPEEPALDKLETLAIRQRLDIDAARKKSLLMHNAVGLARSTRFFGFVEVGVHVHQDPDGPRLFGPTLSLQLPVFDQRQAMIARLEAQQRQADRHLDAVSIEARSKVRAARTRLLGIRQMVEHQRVMLLPLLDRVVEGTQQQYNAMQVGLSQLLKAKREQILGYRGYLDTVRDYWIERAKLERLVGGSLNPPPPKQETTP